MIIINVTIILAAPYLLSNHHESRSTNRRDQRPSPNHRTSHQDQPHRRSINLTPPTDQPPIIVLLLTHLHTHFNYVIKTSPIMHTYSINTYLRRLLLRAPCYRPRHRLTQITFPTNHRRRRHSTSPTTTHPITHPTSPNTHQPPTATLMNHLHLTWTTHLTHLTNHQPPPTYYYYYLYLSPIPAPLSL